jgi:transcriptional regulator with XRE-family HTH domain
MSQTEQNTPTQYGLAIERLRMAKGLTRAELANKSGLSRETILEIETGRTKSPGADVLVKIARALGCDIRELFKGA